MKALRKKEGKRPWNKTAIYRRRLEQWHAIRRVFMASAAEQGRARMAAARFGSAPKEVVEMIAVETNRAIIQADKAAEKWMP